jgi:acylphosphatase
MPTIEFIITGKVQGVFYRGSAKQKADELGLTGWVKNMRDGTVVLRATGTIGALASLQEWCATGPPGAQVYQVQATPVADEMFKNFSVIR